MGQGPGSIGGAGGQSSGRSTRDKKKIEEKEEAIESVGDDSFMDWETRSESIPMASHIIAGK